MFKKILLLTPRELMVYNNYLPHLEIDIRIYPGAHEAVVEDDWIELTAKGREVIAQLGATAQLST